LEGFADFTSRHTSSASLSFAQRHNDIGEGILRNTTVSEVAEISDFNLLASHTYGTKDAKGNIRAGFRLQSLSYNNVAEFSDGRDFTRFEPLGIFSYRLSPDTRALLGGRMSLFDYEDDIRDRTDLTAFTGLEFAASAKLSGSVQIGSTLTQFDAASREDQTSLFVEANLEYRPVD